MIKPSQPIIKPDYQIFLGLENKEIEVAADVKKKAIKKGFREQTSRHITILGFDSIAIRNWLINNPNHSVKEIEQLLRDFDWNFTPMHIYHIEKAVNFYKDVIERRESYISTIDMPDLEKFYKKLNKLLGTNLSVQFPHITLFTKGERVNPRFYGIPIPSKEEFLKLKPILIK